MTQAKSEILQGTLDLMVLKTLDSMGSLHGYGIARRIEQISNEALQVNQGTIYLCLVRLVEKALDFSSMGCLGEQPAKFYSITILGRKQLAVEADDWKQVSSVINRLLRLAPRE